MLYIFYCRDMEKDNHYHVQECEIVKDAREKDPLSYIHTQKEIVQQKGYKPCPRCKPDDPKHVADFLERVGAGMDKNKLRTDKKECPKCGSKNVTYHGTGGGTRFVKEGETAPIEYHDFKCNDCGTEFKYYGDL